MDSRPGGTHAGPAQEGGPATIPADTKLYQRQIDATDAEIDALVYELYGLTEEDIGNVAGRDE